MGNRAKGILGSLPILAVAFGRRQGVEVVIGGDKAETDGKKILLPAMPLECDDALETKAMGFLFHETGHIEFTDTEVFDRCQTAFERHALNVVEDVRMEAVRNATYPGSAAVLAKLAGVVADEGGFGTRESIANAPPQDVLIRAALTRLRQRFLNQPVDGPAALWWERLVPLLGTAGTIKMEALLSTVDQLDTTMDALRLANSIRTLIEDVVEDEPDEAPGSSGDEPDTDDGDPAQNTGQGESEGQDEASDGETAQSHSGGTSGGGSDEGVESSGQASSGPDSGNGKHSPDGGTAISADKDALRQALAAGSDDFSPSDMGEVVGKSLSQEAAKAVNKDRVLFGNDSVPAGTPLAISKRHASGAGELEDVLANSQQLRTRLAAAMEATARIKVTPRIHGSRLDSRGIHKLFTGDHRVFVRKDPARKVNTAVQLLLDRSGSMSGNAVQLARKAALAATVGLGQIHGCKVAAAAFPEIEVLKTFDEQARGAAGRFVIGATGSTPLGPAMIWAASQLVARREERKMLVVVTDGQPDNVAQVKQLVSMYAASGVEVIGVGINTTSVKSLYPVSVVIDSVEALAGALFGVINQRMRRAA